MNSMKLKYKALEIDVINIKESIAGLEEQKELLQADVDYLSEEFDRKYEYLDTLDKDIDTLEAYSRRENIRVFGIPEDSDDTILSIKENCWKFFESPHPIKHGRRGTFYVRIKSVQHMTTRITLAPLLCGFFTGMIKCVYIRAGMTYEHRVSEQRTI